MFEMEKKRFGDKCNSVINTNKNDKSGVKVGGIFRAICVRPDGTIRWEDTAENLVVNVGLNHILDVVLLSGTQDTTWFVGLTNGSPTPASGDIMTSHSGWTENANYSGNRKAYSAIRTNQTVSNSASKAAFAITSNTQTLGGAFINTDTSGTAGILLCCAAFSGGNKAADSGDTVNVQYDFSAADDGV